MKLLVFPSYVPIEEVERQVGFQLETGIRYASPRGMWMFFTSGLHSLLNPLHPILLDTAKAELEFTYNGETHLAIVTGVRSILSDDFWNDTTSKILSNIGFIQPESTIEIIDIITNERGLRVLDVVGRAYDVPPSGFQPGSRYRCAPGQCFIFSSMDHDTLIAHLGGISTWYTTMTYHSDYRSVVVVRRSRIPMISRSDYNALMRPDIPPLTILDMTDERADSDTPTYTLVAGDSDGVTMYDWHVYDDLLTSENSSDQSLNTGNGDRPDIEDNEVGDFPFDKAGWFDWSPFDFSDTRTIILGIILILALLTSTRQHYADSKYYRFSPDLKVSARGNEKSHHLTVF